MTISTTKSNRYTPDNFKTNDFFQMPRFLFQGIYKHSLNSNDRLVYMLIYNHFQLSLKNNWTDNDVYVFIYFSEKDLANEACISQRTVLTCIRHLAELDLIESVYQGAMKSNKIYLLIPAFITADTGAQNLPATAKNFPTDTQKFPTATQELHTATQKLPTSNNILDIYNINNNHITNINDLYTDPAVRKKKNSFFNFDERSYDCDKLERLLLARDMPC